MTLHDTPYNTPSSYLLTLLFSTKAKILSFPAYFLLLIHTIHDFGSVCDIHSFALRIRTILLFYRARIDSRSEADLKMLLELGQPLDSVEKLAIVEDFWRKDPPELDRYEPYLDFYRTETKALCLGLNDKDRPVNQMAAKTHKDIRLIAEKLVDWQDSDLATVIREMQALFPESQNDKLALRLSLWFAIRVQLLLNFRESLEPVFVGDTPRLEWHLGQPSLANMIHRQFPRSNSDTLGLPLPESTLDSEFTAYKLERLYRVEIRWTNCLADHLRFDHGARRLCIFPYRICLHDSGQSCANSFLQVKQY